MRKLSIGSFTYKRSIEVILRVVGRRSVAAALARLRQRAAELFPTFLSLERGRVNSGADAGRAGG